MCLRDRAVCTASCSEATSMWLIISVQLGWTAADCGQLIYQGLMGQCNARDFQCTAILLSICMGLLLWHIQIVVSMCASLSTRSHTIAFTGMNDVAVNVHNTQMIYWNNNTMYGACMYAAHIVDVAHRHDILYLNMCLQPNNSVRVYEKREATAMRREQARIRVLVNYCYTNRYYQWRLECFNCRIIFVQWLMVNVVYNCSGL